MPSPGPTSLQIILLAVLFGLAACDSGPDEPTLVRRQMVIFASARGGSGGMNLWMMTPEGDDLRQLTHYTDGGYYWPMDLSPDGRQVLFRRLDDFSPRSGVYLMALDGPEPQEPLIIRCPQGFANNIILPGTLSSRRRDIYGHATADAGEVIVAGSTLLCMTIPLYWSYPDQTGLQLGKPVYDGFPVDSKQTHLLCRLSVSTSGATSGPEAPDARRPVLRPVLPSTV